MDKPKPQNNGNQEGNDTRETSPLENQSPRSIGQIGPYRLLRILGEGGFSIVYLAERDKPVRRRVALKVIKPGMDTKQVIARFEAERQALALFNHPNIAPVYDIGTTEAGLPFFAMEHVMGVPITEHCDLHKLNIEQRLQLFLQVCEAVQYAHQKGIIHRDIKPSNILISVQGNKATPKIIDFGIAKAIIQPLTERTLFTEQGQFVGTPEYMSPEQAEMGAQDIDTRTDVYSLGVLLYELLTGMLPFETETLRQGGIDNIRRIIREQDPKKPSTRLTGLGEKATNIAEKRNTNIPALTKKLTRELEWIPLMAMRKDRTRRYRSASEFGDDIQRYLNGEPLIAGPESTVYRLSKFIHRNRAIVTAAAVVSIVLIAGIIVSTIFALKASRARAEALRQANISNAVSDFLRNDLLTSFDPYVTGGEVTIKSVFDATSKKLEGRFEEEPLVEASLQHTFGITLRNLGDYNPARDHLERAREILRNELGEENTQILETIHQLAKIYWLQGEYDRAEEQFKTAMEGRSTILGPENEDTLLSINGLALVYYSKGWYQDAFSLYEQIVQLSEKVLGPQHNSTMLFKGNFASVLRCMGNYDEAEELYNEVIIQPDRALAEMNPDTLYSINGLAMLYLEDGRYDDAGAMLNYTYDYAKLVLGQEHPDILGIMNSLAIVYMDQQYNDYSTEKEYYDYAEQLLEEALVIEANNLSFEHPTTLTTKHNLAKLYRKSGRYEESESMFLSVLSDRSYVLDYLLPYQHPDTLDTMYEMAILYQNMDAYENAEIYFLGVIEGRRKVLGDNHPKTYEAKYSLRDLYILWGRTEEAYQLQYELSSIEENTL